MLNLQNIQKLLYTKKVRNMLKMHNMLKIKKKQNAKYAKNIDDMQKCKICKDSKNENKK